MGSVNLVAASTGAATIGIDMAGIGISACPTCGGCVWHGVGPIGQCLRCLAKRNRSDPKPKVRNAPVSPHPTLPGMDATRRL